MEPEFEINEVYIQYATNQNLKFYECFIFVSAFQAKNKYCEIYLIEIIF